MKKILFIDSVHPLIDEKLTLLGFQCDQDTESGIDELKKKIGQYTGIILRSRIRIDRDFIDKALNLRFIGRVGAGMENVDADYAESKGIRCLNSPEGNRDAVGEHTLGMLLSLLNHLSRADRQVRNGKWIREGNRGTEIKGKTIGIIGYGNMGSAFAKRLKGFEAAVISYDKYKVNYSDGNTRETNLEELFREADVISLHVPITGETRHMVDAAFIGRFRKPVVLLNTSRGAVVKTEDLVEGLKSGRILGAALDVLEQESDSFESLSGHFPEPLQYLFSSDKVILTPHIAGWTKESNTRLAEVLVEKIRLLPA